MKVIPDLAHGLTKLKGFVRVHAGGRLVQKQKLRIRCQCPADLQLSLFPIGQLACDISGLVSDPEHVQKIHGLLIHLPFPFAKHAVAQDPVPHAVGNPVVHAHLDIIQNRHPLEQADILERPGDPGL